MNYIIYALLIITAISIIAVTFAITFTIGYYMAASANFLIKKVSSFIGNHSTQKSWKRKYYQTNFDYSYSFN